MSRIHCRQRQLIPFAPDTSKFTQRTTTDFNGAKKKTKKKLQLQFELISDVSSLAPSQLSQIFGLCSALPLSAGLSSSVWAKVKTDFKCEQSSQRIIKGWTNSWLHQKNKKSFPQEQLNQKSLADIRNVGPLFWTGRRCPETLNGNYNDGLRCSPIIQKTTCAERVHVQIFMYSSNKHECSSYPNRL